MDFGKPYYHFCSSDFDTLLHTAVYIQSSLSYTLIDCRNHCSIFLTLPEHLIILALTNEISCLLQSSLHLSLVVLHERPTCLGAFVHATVRRTIAYRLQILQLTYVTLS